MGADNICIKDMANLLLPYDAYSLIKRLKSEVDVPIHLHTHNTTGTGDMTYLMAMQARAPRMTPGWISASWRRPQSTSAA